MFACGVLITMKNTILCFQATDYIAQYPLAEGWGGKHHLFIKLKYVEAKVSCSLTL